MGKLKLGQKDHMERPKGFDNIMLGYIDDHKITFWDKDRREEDGFDYLLLAQTDQRRYTIFFEDVSDDLKAWILDYVKFSNPTESPVSAITIFDDYILPTGHKLK